MPLALLARAALVLLLLAAGCQAGKSTSSSTAVTGTAAVLAPGNGSPLPDATVALLYSQTLTVTSGGGAPYTLSVTGAPPGIGLIAGLPSGVAFVLSGTPTVAGAFTPQFHVTDATGFSTFLTYQLTVQPAASSIAIAPPSLPQATVNTPYTQTLTALAGVPSYTWTIGTGALPPGYVLGPGPNATTTISGVATFSGTYTFTVNVTDGSTPPLKGSTFYSLTVN